MGTAPRIGSKSRQAIRVARSCFAQTAPKQLSPRAWREERQKIHLVFAYDFVLDDADRERIADVLEQALVLTGVLRLLATIIEQEAEQHTTDLLYDWLYD